MISRGSCPKSSRMKIEHRCQFSTHRKMKSAPVITSDDDGCEAGLLSYTQEYCKEDHNNECYTWDPINSITIHPLPSNYKNDNMSSSNYIYSLSNDSKYEENDLPYSSNISTSRDILNNERHILHHHFRLTPFSSIPSKNKYKTDIMLSSKYSICRNGSIKSIASSNKQRTWQHFRTYLSQLPCVTILFIMLLSAFADAGEFTFVASFSDMFIFFHTKYDTRYIIVIHYICAMRYN